MAKFTIGHQKAAQEIRAAMSADERIVCAENLQRIHVNRKNMSFDEAFVQKINRELSAGSIETLRSQKPVKTKGILGVNINLNPF